MKTNKTQTKTAPKIEKLEAQVQELQEKLNRSLADYSNLQKRQEEQQQFFATVAMTSFVAQFIDVLDEFLLAYQHLPDPGLKIAIDKFENTLKLQGLEEIKAMGETFNPETMECVDTLKGEDNKVLKVRKRGYLLNNHCFRPAQVVVGQKNK